MDEKPFQILNDARAPIPMKKGDVKKVDSEYIRDGTVCIFCFVQPHTGEIRVFVEMTRTAVDWAEKIKWLVTKKNPNAEQVVLVCDNLNTHRLSSLYKAYEPEEAFDIASKVDAHYTPVHGSWLDIAEQAINIFTRQCLGRRFDDIKQLKKELKEWEEEYNKDPSPLQWKFTVKEARITMSKCYPNPGEHLQQRDERRKTKEEKLRKTRIVKARILTMMLKVLKHTSDV